MQGSNNNWTLEWYVSNYCLVTAERGVFLNATLGVMDIQNLIRALEPLDGEQFKTAWQIHWNKTVDLQGK